MLEAANLLIKQQQAVLQRLKASAHNAAQPACRLPDDVLSDIFQVGIPFTCDLWSLRSADYLSLFDHNLRLKSIGATCSRFRNVQISTPQCWSVLHLKIVQGKITGTVLEELDVMLSRSRNSSFALRIEMQTSGQAQPSTITSRAISALLLPHMHRCHSLVLACDDRNAPFPLLISPPSLQSLQYISFDWSKDPSRVYNPDTHSEDVVHRILGAIDTPIRGLNIRGIRYLSTRLQQRLSNLQVDALTSLLLDGHGSMGHIHQLLQRCASLEHLRWIVRVADGAGSEIDTHPRSLVLNHLISLGVHNPFTTQHRACILHAPKLEQIHISGHFQNLPFDILQSEQPPFPSLVRVSFWLSPDVEDLSPFFKRQVHLKHCAIALCYSRRRISTNLNVPMESLLHSSADTQTGLRRNLQHLSIKASAMNAPLNPDETSTLLELVLQRLPHLRIDLHLPEAHKIKLPFRNPEHTARVIIDPPQALDNTWPSNFSQWM